MFSLLIWKKKVIEIMEMLTKRFLLFFQKYSEIHVLTHDWIILFDDIYIVN